MPASFLSGHSFCLAPLQAKRFIFERKETLHNSELGWSEYQEDRYKRISQDLDPKDGYLCARVIGVHRQLCRVLSEGGELTARIPGKFFHDADTRSDLPAVGDWVVVRRTDDNTVLVRMVLERRTAISRKVSGAVMEEQIIAANIDAAFIVTGLDENYNLKRIERYLTLVLDFGIDPVVVLNKADVCENVADRVAEVEAITFGFPVIPISARVGSGMKKLSAVMEAGKTYVLLGSSGVGKSTIINHLLGQPVQRVQAVRDDDGRGRHTTSSRELFVLKNGALVIDNPGMREIQLWGDEQGLSEAFEDVEILALECRFGDCTHTHEPGCAVQEAIQRGELEPQRLDSYFKLQKELRHLRRRQYEKLDRIERERWKDIAKRSREYNKHRRGQFG
jgi:ribosome biogenesis GTPase